MAVENKTAYFPLMRQLTETSFLANVHSQQDLYKKSLDLIQEQGHVQPESLSTLKLSMAMHTAAPWIQAHYHLYNSTIVPDRISKNGFNPDCGVWVDWYDRQICTVAELETLVAGGLDRYVKKYAPPPLHTLSLECFFFLLLIELIHATSPWKTRGKVRGSNPSCIFTFP